MYKYTIKSKKGNNFDFIEIPIYSRFWMESHFVHLPATAGLARAILSHIFNRFWLGWPSMKLVWFSDA